MITAHWNGKYIICNTSHFKLVDPAIKEMINKEKQDDNDESINDEQGIYICWKLGFNNIAT